MSHISRHRGVDAAAVGFAVLAVLVIVGCALVEDAQRPSTLDTARTAAPESRQVDLAIVDVPLEPPCKKERKISPAAGETLDGYFKQYLWCADPATRKDHGRYRQRYDHLLQEFRVAFPGADPRQLPPGVTIQILGNPGYESIDPRNAGVESPLR